MKKRHTTERTVNGEKIRVYINEQGYVFISVLGKDKFTITADIIVDIENREIDNILVEQPYLQKIAEF